MSDNNETLNTAEMLRSLPASQVIGHDYVRRQFISVYDAVWKQGGQAAYERESMYFNNQLRDKQQLAECTGLSVFLAFIDLAVRGLTLEPGSQPLCYLLPRSCKVTGADGCDKWEKRCNLTISPYGELVLRTRAGQILHADTPVIVYEGDGFEYGERDGRKYVNYCCRIPRTSQKIIACFIKITRTDGTIDYSVMTESDWKRLQAYSDKQNTFRDSRTGQVVVKQNELYGKNGAQIDTGFLMAKCIKHAFKTYPKIAIGKGSQFETDIVDEPQQFDPYGGVADTPAQDKTDTFAPDRPDGLTVQPDGNDIF